MKWLRSLTLALALTGQLWGAPAPDQALYEEGKEALAEQKFARAREVAESMLKQRNNSYLGLLLMGQVYLYGEGSVPRSYDCFHRAEQALLDQVPEPAYDSDAWLPYAQILSEKSQAANQLERYQEACDLVDTYDRYFTPKRAPIKGFSMLKMGQVDEARALMLKMLDAPEYQAFRGHTLNTLGNIEFESDNLEKSLGYFLQIANEAPSSDTDPVYWSNAGETARDLLRHDEAERYLLRSTQNFNQYTYSDPWGMLAELYATEARMPEALSALKSMQAWRISGSAQVSQNKWASCQARVGTVLMQMGYEEEAREVFERLIQRQDRNSSTSTSASLVEARMAYQYAFALQSTSQRLRERLSYCSWQETPKLLSQLWQQRREMRLQRQKVANLVAAEVGLQGFLQPYGAKALDVPPLSPASWAYFGAGPTIVAAERSLAENRPEMEKRRPYLQVILGEACFRAFQTEKARQQLEEALVYLPNAEVGLRRRCQAVLSEVLLAQGKHSEALHYLRSLMDSDPTQLRACNLALPLQIRSPGGAACDLATRWLWLSPRCRRASGAFVLEIAPLGTHQLEGTLLGPDGTVLGRYRGQAGTNAQEAARSFCEQFHLQAFAPILDLSQVDIQSINGSTGVARPKNLQEMLP